MYVCVCGVGGGGGGREGFNLPFLDGQRNNYSYVVYFISTCFNLTQISSFSYTRPHANLTENVVII